MYSPSGPREAHLLDAVNMLMDARRTHESIGDLPVAAQPATLDEIYWVQDRLAQTYGTIGGWKVGAGTPEAEPIFAPMPLAWMAPSNAIIRNGAHRYRGVEAEVAFLLGSDLPQREERYTDEEVYAAVRSVHPAIEILESALLDPATAAHNTMMGDLQMHGGFIFGPACDDWKTIAWPNERVTLTVDGSVRVERTGSYTSGNLMRLLPWLANEGAYRTQGLRAGQWVTTGSWTGNTIVMSGGTADAQFAGLGRVSVRFE